MGRLGYQQQTENQVIDSIFANLGDITLLLPMSAVAEVVMDLDISREAQSFDWLHGWLHWRDLKLPLLAFEQLLGGEKMPLSQDAKVLVLNTLGKGKDIDFYAILLQELPNPARVSEHDEIKTLRNTDANDYIKMRVELNDRQAIIPDLEALERFVRASLVR